MWGEILSIGSALLGMDASNNAADAQSNSAQQARDLEYQMFQQNRADMAPWREAGQNALTRISSGLQPNGELYRDFTMADFQADPGYGFRLSEGIKALDRSASARGLRNSGGAMKAITRFGQDFASNEYTNALNRFRQQQGDRFNRLASVSGLGQAATQQIGQQGAQMANNAAGYALGAGNARAAGMIGGANALSGGAGQAMNFYNQNRLLDMFQNRGGGGGYNFGYYGYSPYGAGSSTFGTSSGE